MIYEITCCSHCFRPCLLSVWARYCAKCFRWFIISSIALSREDCLPSMKRENKFWNMQGVVWSIGLAQFNCARTFNTYIITWMSYFGLSASTHFECTIVRRFLDWPLPVQVRYRAKVVYYFSAIAGALNEFVEFIKIGTDIFYFVKTMKNRKNSDFLHSKEHIVLLRSKLKRSLLIQQ